MVAITVNNEGIGTSDMPAFCQAVRGATGLPAGDVLLEGADALVAMLISYGDGQTL